MTEQEKINADVQQRLALQDAKFNTFVEEMRDFKNEMRQQNQMRTEEARELRQDMKDMQARFYAKIDNMDAKIDGIGKHVQNLTVAAMVGMGAAVIGIGAIAVSVMYSVFTR